MSIDKKHVRHGLGCARPYLYGRSDLPEFSRKAFGAEELERVDMGDGGFHAVPS